MLEIEIKAYCNDHPRVEKALEGMGAKFIGKVTEKDLYFNHPARNFKNTDEALRIRQSEEGVILTYKGPKLGGLSKTRIEQEVRASDYRSLNEILASLGFLESGSVVKARQKYLLGEIEICLDSVEGLGDFVELEKKGEDREAAERELFNLAGQLGLERFERRSYLELKQSVT